MKCRTAPALLALLVVGPTAQECKGRKIENSERRDMALLCGCALLVSLLLIDSPPLPFFSPRPPFFHSLYRSTTPPHTPRKAFVLHYTAGKREEGEKDFHPRGEARTHTHTCCFREAYTPQSVFWCTKFTKMAVDDMGAELWALVHHLFRKYRRDPRKAVQELALRTHAEWSSEPGAPLPTIALNVKESPWYHEVCSRHASLLGELHTKHQHDIAEAQELVSSLYPDGCNLSEYAEAIRTSAALLPCLVPSDSIDHLIEKRGSDFQEKGLHEVSREELVDDVIEGLMIAALTPRQWWCRGANSVARATKTGIQRDPPTLYIEYERPAGVVHVRRIHLQNNLRPDMPTAQLARRLAKTHEALLSEAQFQSLLIRCQRLQGKSSLSPAATELPTVTAAPTSIEELQPTIANTPSPDVPIARSKKAQKADVGLLFRDPDAALENVDLNDADDVTLQEFKEVMNERFKAKVVKPGDPGYVYDKRVDVPKPTHSSEWDDDSD
ncbi:hypothetical protein, conserved [Leishmania tarentolae]|uniref:Centrosomal protein of 19 kDa n=1 Tax=Leishmania tarentolae TaxID=5689 RepID=A0A640KR41_LEITA|nr:hypothetical protein, conserved [Leishmania tarentolae]